MMHKAGQNERDTESTHTHTRNNTHKLQLERSNVMESVEACQQSP